MLYQLSFAKAGLTASPREIAQQAKAMTVRIIGKNYSQTGVLVGQSGKTYLVLTCQKKNINLDTAQIRLTDNNSYSPISSQTRLLNNVPLTLLAFTSNQPYTTAASGELETNSVGDRIYVAGFLPGENDLDTTFQFTEGIISSLISRSGQENRGFTHTSLIYQGMEGSPIFDSDGKLIGIDCGTQPPLPSRSRMAGLHWGIPIHAFTNFTQSQKQSLGFSAFGSPPPSDVP